MANFYETVICNDARFSSSKRVNDLDLLEPITPPWRAVRRLVSGRRLRSAL